MAFSSFRSFLLLVSIIAFLSQVIAQPQTKPYLGPPKSIKTIFQFPASQPNAWAENFIILPNGTFVVSRLDVPEVWNINPFTAESSLIYTFPDAGVILGIAEYEEGVYGVAVGNFSLDPIGGVPKSWSVWSLDLKGSAPKGRKIAAIPDAVFLNGLVAVKPNTGKGYGQSTILVADSTNGGVYAVDPYTGDSSFAITDVTMTTPTPPTPGGPGGINGIKFLGEYLYFTNSDRGLFARVPLTIVGGTNVSAAGPVESLATRTRFIDDFTVLADGTAFLGTDPDNSVQRYTPGKGFETIVGGLNETIVAGATAALFGVTKKDRNTLYVTTSGGHGGPVNGTFTEPGKIVAISF
jgi:hypothetical protein